MDKRSLLLYGILICGLSITLLHCSGDDADFGPSQYKYVDAVSGNDVANDGTNDRPYRTITKGLSEAHSYNTVIVRPGVYSSELGEVFPLRISQTLTLRGDADSKGSGAKPIIIQGAGAYTSDALGTNYLTAVVLSLDSAISGLQIASGSEVAIFCEACDTSSVISKNTITGNQYGILTAGNAGPRIQGNVISNNTYAGIQTLGKSTPALLGNTISKNGIGVAALNQSLVTMGTTTNPGGNAITDNVNCDLYNATGNQLSAIGNTWDETAALFAVASSCVDGANIVNAGAGTVIYQPAPVGESPVFRSTKEILVSLPASGSVIYTTEPHFVWTPTENTYVMVALFRKLISVKNSSISNPEDIIWVWHSGLGTDLEGDIQFQNGIRVANADVYHAEPYSPLDRGKTYYWAVWAWDSTGTKITDSSREFYFTVSN